MNPHMQNAYSEQGSVEIEQQLGGNSTLSASYQHLRGLHLLISINENTPTCVAAGTNNGCRPNPNYGNNKQYSSAADSQYDGLSISFVQRPVQWGSYRISYTYSKAFDDVSEFFFSAPINNFNIHEDWGRSDDDQRHRLVFDTTVHSSMAKANYCLGAHQPWFSVKRHPAVLLASAVQYHDGSKYDSGHHRAADLPDGSFIVRNAGTGFDFFTLNARLSRTFPIGERFRLQGIAEAFNLLNHRNNLIPNGTFGSGMYPSNPLPTFGQPTAVGDPRTLQLALRLAF